MTEGVDGRPHDYRANGSVVLILALFLLLLSFFILLHSISTFEPIRTRAVVGSLSSTFAAEFAPGPAVQPVTSDSGEVVAIRQFRDKVARAFETTFPIARIGRPTRGEELFATFRADDFFRPGTAEIRPERRAVLDRIAAALGRRPPGLRFELVFYAHRSPEPLATDRVPLPVAQAAAFAEALREVGAPEDSVATAVEIGDPATVRLVFAVRRAEEGRLRFEGIGVPDGTDGTDAR